ncbi:MAG: ATP-dependent DNA helicase, partial [Opitutales bacterium]
GYTSAGATLREIKTVMRPLPANEAALRHDYPEYFIQVAAYLALQRIREPARRCRAELLFLEAGSGLAQTVALTLADEALYRAQLDRVVEFLQLRRRSRERLRHLRYRPAFAAPRPGQETTLAELTAAFERHPAVLFEAPTGFGKTGVLLEFALGQLRSGHFDRVLYLTSKSTGQLQVMHQLQAMTTPGKDPPAGELTARAPDAAGAPAVAAWHVRNKAEHCINHTFHCVRENCAYLDDLETRWAGSGLSRFYRLENQARDLDALRAAGRDARICPYEITRAALAFHDVWIGDYNYVFAPANRGLFYLQPGFDPARTLAIIDEAHNLPARVADAHSHVIVGHDVQALLAELDHLRAPGPLIRAWESYAQLIGALLPMDSLDHALEADLAETLGTIVTQLASQPLDYAALGPQFSDQLWRTPELAEWLAHDHLRKLLWCARAGELTLTCLDAAPAIGETLHAYGGIVLASATLSPVDTFAAACGLDLAQAPAHLPAATPWRDGAYDIAVDTRVDTTFQHRSRHYRTTADTVQALHHAARGPVAVFFPSYAYAEAIRDTLDAGAGLLRVALQPRLRDLAAQTAWVEESLVLADALFLVLGSSFAESIDLLGGRITHAMVVGPALPEVNAVQRARLAEFAALGRAGAFHRVYQVPGMQKVNQALGRLVRAPGQNARVLLHCRRFADITYARLLARDYQFGAEIATDLNLQTWLSAAQPE